MSEHDALLPQHHPEPDASAHPESKLAVYRERTADFLESQAMHRTVITLIAIDAICVLVDVGYAFLSDTCVPAEGPDAPDWLEWLSQISLVITTFFLIEIPLTLWAFGVAFYHPWSGVHHASLHLFDAVVITTTFTLEFVLKGKERELAALLILFRLWRLVKLVGGIAVGAGELEEQTAKQLMATQRKLKETESALAEARKENEELKKKSAGSGSEQPSQPPK